MASTASSSSTSTPRLLYRSLLRELRSNPSNPPKVTRTSAFTSQPLVAYVRDTFRNPSSSSSSSSSSSNVSSQEEIKAREQSLLREMRDLDLFLRSNRIHRELLLRYNPLHDQTEAERVRATARRVGLDVPVEYRAEGSSTNGQGQGQGHAQKGVDGRSSRQRADEYRGRSGPLPPPKLDE